MRRLAVLLAAAGSLSVMTGPAAAAAQPVPRAVDFEQSLDATFTRGRGALVSDVIRAPKRFDLVGLRWRGRRHVHTQIRMRDAAGAWSPWTTMGDEHASGGGSEPVWAGGADAFQLRVERVPRGLRAHFVNATGTATVVDRARTALRVGQASGLVSRQTPAAPRAGRGAPAIVRRAAWGADQCPPRTAPRYGEIRTSFVHHTVSANTYAPEDGPAMVLAICRYHRNSNGWHDIGYNFLVDSYGRVYEGRGGGIDQPVIGAQAQGYNSVSTSVANIGTFTSVAQTPQAVHATAELLAWKLSLHGVPVTGRVTAAGRTFERIAGHRDANATACPGNALYGQLAEIRVQAAQMAPQFGGPPSGGLTLQAVDRTLKYPRKARLHGRLTGLDGAALSGMEVSIQTSGRAGYYTSRRATTGADGAWSATLKSSFSRTLRAIATRADGKRVTSRRLRVAVAPRIGIRAAKRVRVRRMFKVSGSVRPRRGRLVLEVQRTSNGAMRTISRRRITLRSGTYVTRLRLRRPALHRLRVVFKGDARNSSATSPRRYVRIVRRARSR